MKPKKTRTPKSKTTIGTVHPPGTLFMTLHVGEASDQDGHEYTLDVGVGSNSPVVYSETSKRFWTLSWDELLRLAIKAGIDTPK